MSKLAISRFLPPQSFISNMVKRIIPVLAIPGLAVVNLALVNTAVAQDVSALQDEVLKLKGRVSSLEESSSDGCSLDPKKFLKATCPNASLQIGGRIMLDAAWFDHEAIGGESGHEFRRARLFAKGDFAKTWGWKAQFDFADNEVDTKDLYIEYSGFKKAFQNLVIRVGHHKVPFAMQNLTSSKYIPFMERSQSIDFLSSSGADRKTGVGFTAGGAHYSAAAGVFSGGVQKSAFRNGTSLAARLTYAPIAEQDRVIHIGGGVLHRSAFAGNGLRLRARPEIHLAGRAIDTGTIANVDDVMLYNGELAGLYGPYSVQGEYFNIALDRKGDAKTANLNSFYVEAAWWLTGEVRKYSASKGVFGRVKPNKNLSDGGPGAWMLAYRFSRASLADAGIKGGDQNVHTLGLTWKPNPYVALKLNGNLVNGKTSGDDGKDFNDRGIQARIQVDF